MHPELSYGIATPDQMIGLSGRQILQAMIDGLLPAPPIGRTMRFRLTEVGEGTAVFEGEPHADLLNPMGVIHGGWALALLDSVTGCAGQTLLPAGVGYTTVETKLNFCRAITVGTGTVRAEARVVSQGSRILTTEGWLRSTQGRMLAHGTSTLMVLEAR